MREKDDWAMDKTLLKERIQYQMCPYCGAKREDLIYNNAEIDGKEAYQAVDCMVCEHRFTEVYSFRGVILNDYPEDDFRIDLDD